MARSRAGSKGNPLGVGIILLIAAPFLLWKALTWSGTPTVTAASATDMPPGTRVMVEGVVHGDAIPHIPGGFVAYEYEVKRCSRDSDGDKSCSWYYRGGLSPAVEVEAGGVRLQVSAGYNLAGWTHTDYGPLGYAWSYERWSGLRSGDKVVIAGYTTERPYVLDAEDLAAGSAWSYVAGWWVACIVAALLGAGCTLAGLGQAGVL